MIVRLVLAASVLLTIFGAGIAAAPGASACDIVEPFHVTAEHLSEAGFNAPDSQLNRDYQAWIRDDNATIEIVGIYVYETVHYVEGDDDWYAASVSVPVEIWGEWPADTAPQLIDRTARGEDDDWRCGAPTASPVGDRVFSAVGADGSAVRIDDDAEEVLAAAFGAPATAPRNTSVEDDLIAQIDASRRSTTRLFIGGGLAAVAIAGIIMYMSRADAEGVAEI